MLLVLRHDPESVIKLAEGQRVTESDGVALPDDSGELSVCEVLPEIVLVEKYNEPDIEDVWSDIPTETDITHNGHEDSEFENNETSGVFIIARPAFEDLHEGCLVTITIADGDYLAAEHPQGTYVIACCYEDGKVCVRKRKKPKRPWGSRSRGDSQSEFGRRCGPIESQVDFVDAVTQEELRDLKMKWRRKRQK